MLGGSARTLGNMNRTVISVMAEMAAVNVTQPAMIQAMVHGQRNCRRRSKPRRSSAVRGARRARESAGAERSAVWPGALARPSWAGALRGRLRGDLLGFLGGGLPRGLGQIAGIAHLFERRKHASRRRLGRGGRGPWRPPAWPRRRAAAAGAAAAARGRQLFRKRHRPAQRLGRRRNRLRRFGRQPLPRPASAAAAAAFACGAAAGALRRGRRVPAPRRPGPPRAFPSA